MDQVTQQNAAMVEESTAASRNLASETQTLTGLISFFKVSGAQRTAAAVEHAKPVAKPAPARPLRRTSAGPGRLSAAATAQKIAPAHDDWTEF
jgi:methyl-accepting chemotaxis protein